MVLETTVLPLNYAPITVLTEPTNCIIASFPDKSKYFLQKKVSGRPPFSQVCAFTAQTVRKRTGRKRVRNGVLPDPFSLIRSEKEEEM